jgi:hypothetical protein
MRETPYSPNAGRGHCLTSVSGYASGPGPGSRVGRLASAPSGPAPTTAAADESTREPTVGSDASSSSISVARRLSAEWLHTAPFVAEQQSRPARLLVVRWGRVRRRGARASFRIGAGASVMSGGSSFSDMPRDRPGRDRTRPAVGGRGARGSVTATARTRRSPGGATSSAPCRAWGVAFPDAFLCAPGTQHRTNTCRTHPSHARRLDARPRRWPARERGLPCPG